MGTGEYSCAASHCRRHGRVRVYDDPDSRQSEQLWGAFDSVMEHVAAAHQNQPSQLIQNSVDWKYRNANPGCFRLGENLALTLHDGSHQRGYFSLNAL
jgi:hypothetical protein